MASANVSAAASSVTSVTSLGENLQKLEQKQQSLLNSVTMLKQRLERNITSAGVAKTPPAVQQPQHLREQRQSQQEEQSQETEDHSDRNSESDVSLSITSEQHIPFELVKKGYDLVETFFVVASETSPSKNPSSSRESQLDSLLNQNVGSRVTMVVDTSQASNRPSLLAPKPMQLHRAKADSQASASATTPTTSNRQARFVHAINRNGQHVFIVLDVAGVVSSAPCDPILSISSSKHIPEEFLEECDEVVRATNSSVLAVHGNNVCVYSKEADMQFRRQVFQRMEVDAPSSLSAIASSDDSKVLANLSGSFLDSDKQVKHYPIVRCSLVLSSPEEAEEVCDKAVKSMIQCSIRLSSKKLVTMRSNVKQLLLNMDRYDTITERFLANTRKSLSFLQSVQDSLEDAPDNKQKIRFNIQKRLEYVSDFSQSQNCFLNEALHTIAYLNSAMEHLSETTLERAERMQYILEPVSSDNRNSSVPGNKERQEERNGSPSREPSCSTTPIARLSRQNTSTSPTNARRASSPSPSTTVQRPHQQPSVRNESAADIAEEQFAAQWLAGLGGK